MSPWPVTLLPHTAHLVPNAGRSLLSRIFIAVTQSFVNIFTYCYSVLQILSRYAVPFYPRPTSCSFAHTDSTRPMITSENPVNRSRSREFPRVRSHSPAIDSVLTKTATRVARPRQAGTGLGASPLSGYHGQNSPLCHVKAAHLRHPPFAHELEHLRTRGC